MVGTPPAGQPRRRQAGPTGQLPTRPGQGKAAGLDPPGSAATARARRDARAHAAPRPRAGQGACPALTRRVGRWPVGPACRSQGRLSRVYLAI